MVSMTKLHIGKQQQMTAGYGKSIFPPGNLCRVHIIIILATQFDTQEHSVDNTKYLPVYVTIIKEHIFTVLKYLSLHIFIGK